MVPAHSGLRTGWRVGAAEKKCLLTDPQRRVTASPCVRERWRIAASVSGHTPSAPEYCQRTAAPPAAMQSQPAERCTSKTQKGIRRRVNFPNPPATEPANHSGKCWFHFFPKKEPELCTELPPVGSILTTEHAHGTYSTSTGAILLKSPRS